MAAREMFSEGLQFEVEDKGLEPFGIRGRGKGIGTDQTQALFRILQEVIRVANEARGLADAPDELELQIGLRLAAEGSFIVTRGQDTANLSIKMTWHREK